MKRRDFSIAALALVGGPALAQDKPVAGTHYQVLGKRAAVEAPADKIEVVEFFWYSCPHCAAFEPSLQAWSKGLAADVVLRRVPRRFADSEVPQQQLYYALEAMGLVDKLHAKVFSAIHGERKNLQRGPEIADWVASQGVDRAKFIEHYNSMSVQLKASRALALQDSYRVEGVPSLGVAGRYLSDVDMAGSGARLLQVADALLAHVRANGA